jgi:UDP-hydrolysing UDP-N-acetyl-D-glucosamine 2-epimerase
VFNSGAPGIDNIVNLDLLSKDKLEENLDWKFSSKSALFTYHPVTLGKNDIPRDLKAILNVLIKTNINVLFTYANADNGGRFINQKIEEFCRLDPIKYKVVKSLGQLKYLSAMKHTDLLIGNTSSGIIEAASFGKPVVNIGDRQKGRLKGKNVIDCNLDTLESSINLAISSDFKEISQNTHNIYGVGIASDIILNELVEQEVFVTKKFIDSIP